ncbi:MAG: T9SS type A sorting domain-containing protein [Candidatus Latescibacteria bacterium]|nr:T9SS type A sorting domain-containing protein [Candidatus Latescibacterota bacterium]
MKWGPPGLLAWLLFLLGSAQGQEAPYGLGHQRQPVRVQVASAGPSGAAQLRPVFTGLEFTRPLYLTHAGDGSGRFFVVERSGLIKVFREGDEAAGVFLDIADRVSDFRAEIGLLGLAFHPQYRDNGRFYVYYIARGLVSRLSEFRRFEGDRADVASERILLEVRQPADSHNGGQLAFGPDGYLYWGLGDGANPDDVFANGQDPRTLLGAILRLDIDGGEGDKEYAIPPDNPFVGNRAGWREEIWAWGLRNPWRFSFDPRTGQLWVGDVGQDRWEEINRIEKGGNYGWNMVEGPECLDPAVACSEEEFIGPVWAYDHSQGRSVIGGYVYRGAAVPGLQGLYIYGDFATGQIWGLEVKGDLAVENRAVATAPGLIVSLGQDERGELYVVGLDGTIMRLEAGPQGGESQIPARLSETGLFADMARQQPAPGLIPYAVNAPLWSDGAPKRRWLALPDSARIGFAQRQAWAFPNGTVLVKNFYLPGAGDSELGRIVETRLLVKRITGPVWDGFSYEWNEAGTQAVLLTGRASRWFTAEDLQAPGGQRRYLHHFPSGADCIACHTPAAGYVLGVRTGQLNRLYDYGPVVDNQLRSFNHLGLFGQDIGQQYSQWPQLPDPLGGEGSVAGRARAYLDANCAHCHRPGGGGRVALDLRYDTPLEDTGLLAAPVLGDMGLEGAQRLAPGSPTRSLMYRRMLDLGRWRMPPLASGRVDQAGLELMVQWIAAQGGTAVVEGAGLLHFQLAQNYPNPFNQNTILPYRLAHPGPVRLALYGASGQLVRVLQGGFARAGEHRAVWDGRDAAGRAVASGVYLARLQVGPNSQVRKIVLLR